MPGRDSPAPRADRCKVGGGDGGGGGARGSQSATDDARGCQHGSRAAMAWSDGEEDGSGERGRGGRAASRMGAGFLSAAGPFSPGTDVMFVDCGGGGSSCDSVKDGERREEVKVSKRGWGEQGLCECSGSQLVLDGRCGRRRNKAVGGPDGDAWIMVTSPLRHGSTRLLAGLIFLACTAVPATLANPPGPFFFPATSFSFSSAGSLLFPSPDASHLAAIPSSLQNQRWIILQQQKGSFYPPTSGLLRLIYGAALHRPASPPSTYDREQTSWLAQSRRPEVVLQPRLRDYLSQPRADYGSLMQALDHLGLGPDVVNEEVVDANLDIRVQGEGFYNSVIPSLLPTRTRGSPTQRRRKLLLPMRESSRPGHDLPRNRTENRRRNEPPSRHRSDALDFQTNHLNQFRTVDRLSTKVVRTENARFRRKGEIIDSILTAASDPDAESTAEENGWETRDAKEGIGTGEVRITVTLPTATVEHLLPALPLARKSKRRMRGEEEEQEADFDDEGDTLHGHSSEDDAANAEIVGVEVASSDPGNTTLILTVRDHNARRAGPGLGLDIQDADLHTPAGSFSRRPDGTRWVSRDVASDEISDEDSDYGEVDSAGLGLRKMANYAAGDRASETDTGEDALTEHDTSPSEILLPFPGDAGDEDDDDESGGEAGTDYEREAQAESNSREARRRRRKGGGGSPRAGALRARFAALVEDLAGALLTRSKRNPGGAKPQTLSMNSRIRAQMLAHRLSISYRHVQPCAYKDRHYCMNGGTCVFVGALDIKTCRCPIGYTGVRCELIDQEYILRLLNDSILFG